MIDGQAWSASSTSRKAQVGPFGAITIQGLANGTTLLLILYNIDSVGTYPLGMGGTAVGGLGQVSDLTGRGWSTPLSGAAGSVTITTLSSSRIVGTFTYDADSLLGSAHGTRAVTAGQFDLLLGGTFAPLPDNAGSRLDGTVGGAPWLASTVVMQLQAGTLVIGASNTAYTLSVAVTGFTGPGTYTVGSAPGDAVVTMIGPVSNPFGSVNCCWGGGGGNTGTLTVTALSATRLQGTLSASLPPTPATSASGTLTVSGVTFDIGIP